MEPIRATESAAGPSARPSLAQAATGGSAAAALPGTLGRTRLIYAAMSVLLVWHTVAMALAVMPEGAVSQGLRSLFGPYITLLRLDNHWGFFAPNVGAGQQFRYVVEDAGGARHSFVPAERLNDLLPTSIWFKDRYKTIMQSPELFGRAAAETLCREHAALRPLSVTLIAVEQKDFWPADRLAGKSPLDAEFVDARTLGTMPCAAT